MRIWLVTQYYPPEVGAAPVRLSRLARMLVALGHEVSVLTAMPNYPDGVINPPYRGRFAYAETIDGVTVRRVWLYTSPSKRARARYWLRVVVNEQDAEKPTAACAVRIGIE